MIGVLGKTACGLSINVVMCHIGKNIYGEKYGKEKSEKLE
jgi:hypothetical protein